jgi:histidine triad (HIT) family protein
MDENCIFCKIIDGQISSDKVYDDDHMIAFRDINPQAPTHIVIVPRKHIPYIADMGDSDEPLIGHLIHTATKIAQQEGLDQGYRIVVNNGEQAGQTVFHIHFHLLGGRAMSWPPG